MTSVAEDEVARGERVIIRRKRLSDAAADYAWRRDNGQRAGRLIVQPSARRRIGRMVITFE